MPSRAVLYDPRSGHWCRFSQLLEEIEVHELDRVLPTLQTLEARVESEQLYAAGFLSYEAAPAFDAALQTSAAGAVPLLRFGLFARMEPFDLPEPGAPLAPLTWQAAETPAGFAGKVAAIRAAIARGETYQVNLTFPLSSAFPHDPWLFFLQLVQGEPPGQCGFLQSDHWAICSASPELFFTREDERLTMRPMKGTAPRGRTLAEDRQRATRLQGSAKDRAENVMILDMVRNDLGRIAPPGAVHTEAICTLEKYPTVWQMTSTATARSSATLAEIFQALFPCASITGAPKVQTMRIIRQAESRPRQVYTGAFGWIAPGRRAHFSVAIRTLLIDRRQQHATYGVGAGITWDSVGADEYQECLDKAAVLTNRNKDFALIETLRWTPGKGYFVLREHLARLQASAEYFDFHYAEVATRSYLEDFAAGLPALPQRVRLLLHRDGRLEGSAQPLAACDKGLARIALAAEPVDVQDVLLFHKTTQRQRYERALATAPDMDEVVLWNERGEVTECCTANLVIERDGKLVTPPVSSGLLPGTYRDYLIGKGVIREQVIHKEDLVTARRIFLVNAVRKWRKACLVERSER